MPALFVVILTIAIVVLILRSKKNTAPRRGDVFPVTIIQGGKTVTFNGFDEERREREFAAALAQTRANPAQDVAKPEQSSKRHEPSERMTVVITGTLKEPRAQVAIKINSTQNARFVDRVFLDTDYLVATRSDTAKSKAAAENGTIVITEQQLSEYIDKGEFPQHPRRQTHSDFNFDESEIEWADSNEPPVPYRLTYASRDGELSERVVEVLHFAGKHPNGHEYLAAYDEGDLKTFRRDRILRLDELN
ncbi:MAG: hypothetical protein ABSD59_01265 [Terracidiphilus sp.]|jgi:hypothetical protein